MNPIETLGLALGAGFSSGLNLYATVATLGLLQHFGVLHLPPGLQPLAHPWVLGIAIALYLLEFVADKIPYFTPSGTPSTPSFVRPLRRFWPTRQPAEPRPSGGGARPSSPAESLSLRTAPKPARAPR